MEITLEGGGVRLGRGSDRPSARLASVWRSQKASSRRSLAIYASYRDAASGKSGTGSW